MSRRNSPTTPTRWARCIIVPLILSFTAPLGPIPDRPALADPGAYVTAGSGNPLSIRAGVVLDLAGERPGANRRLDAQMHVLAESGPSDCRDILLFGAGYGVEYKLGGDARRRSRTVGAALIGSAVIHRRIDRRTGAMGSGALVHLDAYGLLPVGSRLHGVLGVEQWLVPESRTVVRIGVRVAFRHDGG